MIRLLLFGFCTAAVGCTPVDGPWINGADLSLAAPALTGVPAQALFGRSPDPGQVRTFSEAQLESIAGRYLKPAAGLQPVCFERRTREMSAADLDAEIRKALDGTAYQFQVLDFSPLHVPPGKLVLPLTALLHGPRDGAGGILWRGRYEYDGGRSISVWIKLRVWEERDRVEAAKNLPLGKTLSAEDLRTAHYQAPPGVPGSASMQEIVGMALRRSVRAGDPLTAEMLMPPAEVERGDVVSVVVQGGGASLRLQAVAQSTGRRGQFIVVKNMESGKLFRAQVQGLRAVGVEYGATQQKN